MPVMTDGPEPQPADEKKRLLSDALEKIVVDFAHGPVTLSQLLNALHEQAWTLLLILISLPFCTPIPLPGVSTPFGAVMALIGFSLFLGRSPWVPRRLLDTALPAKSFPKVLRATERLTLLLERVIRPRWSWLIDLPRFQHAYGFVIFICGVLLLLPLPIPFSNTFPAWTVLFISCAMIGRDGYLVIAAGFAFAITLAYFGAIFFGSAEAFYWLRHSFDGVWPAS
jgi:hypothetical protein